jgi:hypothetical protein
MDLHTPPFHNKVELLLQLFDDALADVAEWSDVIGKDLNMDGHRVTFPRRRVPKNTTMAQPLAATK